MMALNFHNQRVRPDEPGTAVAVQTTDYADIDLAAIDEDLKRALAKPKHANNVLTFPQVTSVAEEAVSNVLETRLTKPQTRIYTSTAKYTCGVAGMGSGKSEAAIKRILTTKMMYPNIDLAYLAPTYQLISDIFYPRMEEALTAMGLMYRINKKENVISILGHGKVYCRSMDKPEYIIGWEVGDAFLDEFDVLKVDKAMDVLRKISARCRQQFPDGKLNQLFFTTTPEGFKATYNLFKKPETKLDNSNLIQMSTYSNAHNLPKGYIEDLKQQYPEELIEAYLMGNFVNLTTGSVYSHYDRERNRSAETIHRSEPLYIGMDFNVGRMCAVVLVKRGEHSHAVDELVNLYDTPAMIEAIQERYVGHHMTIFPDATGKSRRSTNATTSDHIQLRNAGFRILVDEINPPIKNRVAAVNNGFEKKYLHVNDSRCPHLADKLEQQVYDDNGIPEKDGTEDILDAFGYPVAKIHRIKSEVRYNYVRRERKAVGGY